MRYVWLALLLFACKSEKREEQLRVENKPAVKTDMVSGDENMVQPRFSRGNAAPSDDGSLGFTITKVHTGRKASATAPFHEAGGDWTYIEAHVDGDPAATFVVGMPVFAPVKGRDGFGGFGSVMFAPTTSEAGAKVVTHLAKAVRVTPPAAKPGGVLQAMKVPIAVLGTGIGKTDNGYGGKGTWLATKMFCSDGNVEAAELFFNVDVASKRGEFSEKDADYNADVVKCLATVLRDGLPPPRTTENDPTLAAKGPRLELGKRIGGRRMEPLAFTQSRTLMLDERGTEAAIVEVDLKTGATKELFKTPERLEHGKCDAQLAHCLVKGSKPGSERNVFGGDDKALLFFVDGAKVSALDTASFSPEPSLTRAPISPDGRFIVVQESDYKTGTKLFAIDRQTKQMSQLKSEAKGSFDVVEWTKDGGKWVAIVADIPYDENAPLKMQEWHLEAKGITKPSKRTEVPDEKSALSPDGKRRADFKDGTLTLTVGGKARTLKFHPDDARHVAQGCCAWIDNRLIEMRNGFIDTDDMKVSLVPKDPEDDDVRVEYMRGTRNALVFKKDGVYQATLVGP